MPEAGGREERRPPRARHACTVAEADLTVFGIVDDQQRRAAPLRPARQIVRYDRAQEAALDPTLRSSDDVGRDREGATEARGDGA